MKLVKKIAKIVLVAVITVTCISEANVFAATSSYDDEFDFKFQIGAWWGNGSVEEGCYRQTKKANNAWKVELLSSEEGDGTYTKFWLENSGEENVSGSIKAKQGAGACYKAAYESASQTDVYLTGENNN